MSCCDKLYEFKKELHEVSERSLSRCIEGDYLQVTYREKDTFQARIYSEHEKDRYLYKEQFNFCPFCGEEL